MDGLIGLDFYGWWVGWMKWIKAGYRWGWWFIRHEPDPLPALIKRNGCLWIGIKSVCQRNRVRLMILVFGIRSWMVSTLLANETNTKEFVVRRIKGEDKVNTDLVELEKMIQNSKFEPNNPKLCVIQHSIHPKVDPTLGLTGTKLYRIQSCPQRTCYFGLIMHTCWWLLPNMVNHVESC